MWDSQNSRYFTALSRGWVFDKFGGWGVWLNDLLFHALLAASVGDKSTALANLEVVMSGQQRMVFCLVYSPPTHNGLTDLNLRLLHILSIA